MALGDGNADVGEEISDRGLQVRAVLSGSIGVVDPTRPVCAQGHCGNCVFAERIHGGRFGPDRHESGPARAGGSVDQPHQYTRSLRDASRFGALCHVKRTTWGVLLCIRYHSSGSEVADGVGDCAGS